MNPWVREHISIPVLRRLASNKLFADIMFLCTGLRPVILMDYGGTMPQLQDNLCSLLHHARQVTTWFRCVKFSLLVWHKEPGMAQCYPPPLVNSEYPSMKSPPLQMCKSCVQIMFLVIVGIFLLDQSVLVFQLLLSCSHVHLIQKC
jgi:hypothetical protein